MSPQTKLTRSCEEEPELRRLDEAVDVHVALDGAGDTLGWRGVALRKVACAGITSN